MKNILLLLVFLQIFLIFGQAIAHDRLSARSSASVKVSSTSFVKRKTKKQTNQASNDPTTDQPTTGEQPMTCSVSRYVRQTGLASDCVCAIAFLYDPSFPACTICRTCVVQPLDSKEITLGGRTDKQGRPIAPSVTLARMNSAYDSMFKAQVYSDDTICDHYTTPFGLLLDPTYVPERDIIYPTFLLGIQAGQGDVAMACNASLAAQAYREAM
ncbi:uncharacterized protein MELLADRAFT_104387 [Melampsora larici-populina 98AG31]|uniref:Secreted protein n=1 Tax=Melampsora larici-populina (strain 98AG31 / pathotype 3-4-7) TaxID=747676 RepID=F4REI5_MELLP|nr:uncharacterized protein MELLADRAFT_104387 [Melampsora larici-populina 98AG31]EGG09098.1 secreted protein [Melampsora larici-populina 98AG31]